MLGFPASFSFMIHPPSAPRRASKKKRARAAVNELAAQVKKQASVEEASVPLDPASVPNSDNWISPSAALSALRDFKFN